ncbi:mitochondrial ribonuclease P catalytic subunit [Microcaecilia unicolor]|uniref:Mitochondrial ribonuclease P catalytic subunit n=1 Tax=Microcaecilia unicolor TaxID=1415580 RepID=A0A6P7YQQ8_9AMPH|nr:mitochondrial ribonuclease P catalytic subunit [Microcaecilia unicolor]
MMFLCAFKVPSVLHTALRNGLPFPAIACHLPVVYSSLFYRHCLYKLGCFPFTTSPKFTCPENCREPPAIKNDKPIKKEGRVHNKTAFPFSVFSAGAAERRKLMLKWTEETKDSKGRVSKQKTHKVPSKPLCAQEWKILKEESNRIKEFEEHMMQQIVISNCDINVAKSLLVFAAKESSIGYKLLRNYLILCANQNRTSEIYDVYEIMKARFKTLDTSALSLFIRGFSQTDHWEESLSLLETMKKVVVPSRRDYSNCILGALGKKKWKIAWDLYYEMLKSNLTPRLDTLKSLFDTGKDLKDDMFKSELVEVLLYMRHNRVYPDEALMWSIKSWFESIPGENWKGYVSAVESSGRCPTCSQSLESINLSQEEYGSLKDVILNDVIQGTDTFRKTTPEELQEFQTFVASHPPFDIVIDGLNIAGIFKRGCRSQILLSVVSYLAQRKLRLLVLGRKHMLNEPGIWLRQHMDLIQQRANCFFMENISEDDPFLLYATIHSGNQCRFITRDLLRDHRACLSDIQIKHLFLKWQRGHQLVISHYSPGNPVTFQPILSYDTIIQTTGDTWHIPYDMDNVTRASYEVPRKWLCLQRQNHKI